MIDTAHAKGGKVVSLTSYGAGIPAFECNNNPFGYKFSWDPKGLMRSAVSPAASFVDGRRIEIPQKFKAHRLVDVHCIGTFETYPSNDSSRYIPLFGLNENITVYKGLLRYIGWCNTIIKFLKIRLIENTEVKVFSGMTYWQFMATVVGVDPTTNVRKAVAKKMGLTMKDDIIKRMDWLGLFSDKPVITKKGTNSDVLVDLMLTKMAYGPGEQDMIIVHNELEVEFPDRKERHISSMLVKGIPYGDTAMARAVSLPAAIAARLVLEGKIKTTGVQMPSSPEMYLPILKEMAEYGFTFKETVIRL
jgi:saccharopine dehydrogenase (NADP+, L-glutamate forming)